ncbi:MAG: hypothetical protein LAT83_01730 [Kiritimatiellae bacterium]|nr:hypothetical protein [Kiritimatiellia bacterium]
MPQALFCPLSGVMIRHPFLEMEQRTGVSPATVFIWDNISGKFSHTRAEVDTRIESAMAAVEEECGEANLEKAFEQMIKAWNQEEDSILHFCLIGSEGFEFHVAFDLTYEDYTEFLNFELELPETDPVGKDGIPFPFMPKPNSRRKKK